VPAGKRPAHHSAATKLYHCSPSNKHAALLGLYETEIILPDAPNSRLMTVLGVGGHSIHN